MAHYRLYRLGSDDSIFEGDDLDASDDAAAIAEAVLIHYAAYIEIWCGTRMVSRVAPANERSAL